MNVPSILETLQPWGCTADGRKTNTKKGFMRQSKPSRLWVNQADPEPVGWLVCTFVFHRQMHQVTHTSATVFHLKSWVVVSINFLMILLILCANLSLSWKTNSKKIS